MNDNEVSFYGDNGPRNRLTPNCFLSGLALFCATSVFASEDLGIIQVDSTTIDDKFEQKRGEPSNIGIVSGKTVDRAHTENIQQLLQSIPGVTTEVQSGDSLKIHIRGIENQVYMGERPGVAVVIDGVPVFERTGRVNIDMDNIESIKVIKGGASYLFGDDALGGAVIITTKRGASQAGVKLSAEVGSFDYRKKIARIGHAGENWNGHIQFSERKTDGYYDDSASESDYVNGKLQYYIDDYSDLTFGFEQAERMKNSHGALRGVTAAKEDPKSKDPNNEYSDYANHYDVELEKYFLTYSRDFNDADNLMVNIYQYTDDTAFVSSPANSDPSVYNYDNDYSQIQRGLKLEYRAGGERVGWMAAADLRDNEYENLVNWLDCLDVRGSAGCVPGNIKEDNLTEEKVKAVYGEVKVKLSDPLVMTVNGRYDRLEYDFTDNTPANESGKKNFDVTSWRLGMNYAMQDNLDLYGNISTGFRTPTAKQLFIGNSNPSSAVAANPNLKEETSRNIEIGLRSSTEFMGTPIDLDVAVFQIERQDYINPSHGVYTTGTDNMYENIGDVRNRGLELTIQNDDQRTFSWEMAYTYLDAEYTKYDSFNLQLEPIGGACPNGGTPIRSRGSVTSCHVSYDNAGNQISRTPNHRLNLIARYRPTSHWTITGEATSSSSYYADEINQEEISGHTVYNLLVNYDREVGKSNWSFFARVDNLFDKFYYNTARARDDANEDGVYNSEDLSIVVNQGRTFTAGLSVSF